MITVIGSLKGGSGKSTTSFNLAVWLLAQDFSTAIFDLDPQQTLVDASDFRAEDDIQPALNVIAPKSRIYERLLEAGETHSEVLVDIGNSDMAAVRKAYKAADRIVVPVLPSQSDVWSLQRFLKFLKTLDTKPDLEIVTFINRADTHHAVMETRETLAVLKQLPEISVITKMLSQRLGFRRSFSEGLGIFELEPRSKAAAEFLFFAHALFPNKHRTKTVKQQLAEKSKPASTPRKKATRQKTAKKPILNKKATRKKTAKKSAQKKLASKTATKTGKKVAKKVTRKQAGTAQSVKKRTAKKQTSPAKSA